MSKYERLGTYLREHGSEAIPMTFAEIERVVGTKLPKSQKHQAWWSNSTSNNVMTQVWLDAGYRTEQVDVAGRKLVFRRATPPVSGMKEEARMFEAPRSATTSAKPARHPAFGALKGLFTVVPGYDVAAPDPEEGAEWDAAANRTADQYEAGRLRK